MARMDRADQKGQKGQRKKKLFLKRRPSRPCYYCENEDQAVDYKDIQTLSLFQSDRGKILSPKQSSLCAKHQRSVAMAIKRSREIGLMPYTA